MLNLSPQQKEVRVQKIADQQGISRGEALEILETLLRDVFIGSDGSDLTEGLDANEDLETPVVENTGEDTPAEEGGESVVDTDSDFESLENDAIEKDFDIQMNHDTMDEPSMQSAQQNLVQTVARLRQVLKTSRKVAFGMEPTQHPSNDPRQKHLDEVSMMAQNQNPDITPEEQLYARQMMEEMHGPDLGQQPIDQDAKLLEDIAGHGENRFDRALARWADPRFGIPEKEGKIYRSNINRRIFKTTTGKYYRLKLAMPDDYDMEMQSEETIPASAPMDNGAAPLGQGAGPNAEELGSQYNLGEEEKSRLAQIIADAEGNQSSAYRLFGLVAGFLGDQKLMAIATSQQEKSEMAGAWREGAMARGGNSQLAPTAKKKG